ncbi:MAG TPA: preprotein translocase subunit YajC [Dehalococcoidia bacterium]|nr:preprotein translocase subunit YajC [Dehalococcoidia bacterium]
MGKSKILTLVLIAGLLITTLVFVGGCYTATEGEEGGGGFDWTIIIFIVLIFAVFYFLMIRPQRKRQKEHQQLMEELNRGDKVITAGGIYGVIESVSEDSVLIKVESGTMMRVAKGSVAIKREQ